MKRTFASLLPIGLVFSATAYAAAPMLPEEMPVFDEKDRFVIGAEAHYFRMSQTDMGYVVTTDADGNEKLRYLNPDFGLDGGRLFASYMFTNENDIQLSWTHTSADDNNKTGVTTADVASFAVGGAFQGLEADLTGAEVVGLKKDLEIDLVDLDMGRVFHDENYMVRIFAGVRYATIQDDLKYFSSIGDVVTSTKSTSDLDGVGPRGGFDARYRLMDHVSVTGHVGAALIKGYIDSKTTFPTDPETHAKTDQIQSLVPNLDARLGLAVDFLFDNGWGVVVEGGFHADHFFNAATSLTPGGFPVTRDVSTYGPYLGLAVMFS